MLPEPESFDLVFTTWGTIGWLPDVAEWARIIAWFLKPGGKLCFADGHPAAFVFDEVAGETLPQFAYPYTMAGEAIVTDDGSDYAGEGHTVNTVTHEWMHPLSDVVTALLDAGLSLDFLHEHYQVPFQMFDSLVDTGDRMFGWPEQKWLPLSYSIGASASASVG